MKIAIITGSSSGLGHSLSKDLLNRDYYVIGLGGRQHVELGTNFEHIRASFDRRQTSYIKQAQRAFNRVLEISSNPTEVLFVHCAATVEPLGVLGTLDALECESSALANYVCAVILLNLFLEKASMISGRKTAVMITSGASVIDIRGAALYCASKAGVEALVRVTYAEQLLSKSPVRVLAVRPGVFESPMQHKMRNSDFPDAAYFRELKDKGNLEDTKEKASTILDRVLNTDAHKDWLLQF